MRKHTVYLDTTIPSYLFDDREELQTLVQITQQWWTQERQNFDLYLSEETLIHNNTPLLFPKVLPQWLQNDAWLPTESILQ